MNDAERKKVRARLNRIAGQVNGIGRMIEEDRYCVDILNQISAVRNALDALGVEMLTSHIEGCVVGHGTGTEHHCARTLDKEQLLDEVRTSLSRFLK
jgi:DNA-binding FrmR family transcriptional regulator